MHGGLRARFVCMNNNGFARFALGALAALTLTLGLGACAGQGDINTPAAGGPGTVDTRSTAFPGSVMPAVGGASNGGGVSGGGAGVGSIGGGR